MDIQDLFEDIIRAELDSLDSEDFADYFCKWGEIRGDRCEIEDDNIEDAVKEYLDLYEVEHKLLREAIINTLIYKDLRDIIQDHFEMWYEDYERPRLAKEKEEEVESDDASCGCSDKD